MQSLMEIFATPLEQIRQHKFYNVLMATKISKDPDAVVWLCKHPDMSMDVYFANEDIPWNMEALSANHAIEPINAALFPKLNWNYHLMSRHPKLDNCILELCPNKPWDYQYIASRSNTNVSMIMATHQSKHFLGTDRYTTLCISKMKLPGFGECNTINELIENSNCEYDGNLFLDDPNYLDPIEQDMLHAIAELV